MPQMMPLNWILLFIFFVMTFLIMNSLNYFTKTQNFKKNTLSPKKNKINWKW